MNSRELNPQTDKSKASSGVLVAVLVGLATVVFIGVPLIFLSGNASQDGLLLQTSPTGPVSEVDGEDIRTSVTSAVSDVLGAQGYISQRIISVDNAPVMSTWVRSSSTGEFEAVQFSNPTLVLDMFSQGGSAPSLSTVDDQPAEAVALASAGESTLKAENGDSWDSIEASANFNASGVDLHGMAAGDDDFFYLNQHDVSYTKQATADGGELWTMKTSGDSALLQQWKVGRHGFLRYYRVDFPGPAPFTLELVLQPLDTQPEIALPEVGSALDLNRFDVPGDLVRP